MDNKLHKEIMDSLTGYLKEKNLRKTEERDTILETICTIKGHFDIAGLHNKLKENKFHVSQSTLYNTLDLLLDAGIVVAYQFKAQSAQFELTKSAETHFHLYCKKCGGVREIKNTEFKSYMNALKVPRFTPEFSSLFIYGICTRCKNKALKEANKQKK